MDSLKLISIQPWWVTCLGLFNDGTVRSIEVNNQQPPSFSARGVGELASWNNICAVDSSRSHVVGLRSDGTVLVLAHDYKFEKYKRWNDIIQIAAGYEVTAGLIGDGTVVYEYSWAQYNEQKDEPNDKLCKITNVKLITDKYNDVVGLRLNGELFCISDNKMQVIASGWNEVEMITATIDNIYGLKKDKTVVSVYKNDQTDKWKDIEHIDSGHNHIVGLKNDGTVVADGMNDHNQCNVEEWRNVNKIYAGCYHTVGINNCGEIVIANNYWV